MKYKSFFDRLWLNKPDAYLSTWLMRSGATRHFHSSELHEAETYLLEAGKVDDAYFCVGLLSHVPARGRGTAADIGFLPAFHMDFDIAARDGNVHAKSALPESFDELNAFLVEAEVPQPKLLVNSGNGIHAYWPLIEPLDVRNPSARAAVAKRSRDFQMSIIGLAKSMRGWSFDNTSDLARVLRFPGTLNHKTNPAKPVELLNAGY